MAVHNATLHPLVKELNTDMRIALIVADFNADITHEIEHQTMTTLHEQGFEEVDSFHVPGAFELPAMTKEIADKGIYSLIIVIGCLINGETPHFHYIADAVSHGLIDISMSYDMPCIFGLLTCDTHEQAKARINNNYAIYGLNYLVQRHLHQETLHEKMEKLMQQAGSVIEDIMDKS